MWTNGAPVAPFFCVGHAADPVLRHNQRMQQPVLFRLMLAAAMLVLAACEPVSQQQGPRAAGGNRLPAQGQGDFAMEFRGRRPCVDCQGIDAWLRLEQRGGEQRYELVERYLAADGERRCDDAGEWRAEDDLLRLRSDDGGERVYARMPDDSLLARASDGGPLAAAADDVLLPTDFQDAQ